MSHRYYPTHVWHNEEKVLLKGNDWTHKVTYAPDVIQEKTLEFIENNSDKPFFPHYAKHELDNIYVTFFDNYIQKTHQTLVG